MIIHALLSSSRANGPGLRSVVYVQGCRLACPRCWNPGTHAFFGDERSVDELADWAMRRRGTENIDGVTFSGGEPMHQAAEIHSLIQRLKDVAPEMSFGVFSGYSEAELGSGSFWTRDSMDCASRSLLFSELQGLLDFAVLGRFNHRLPALDPLRTSRNQRLHLYSTRHSEADFEAPQVEVMIEPHGLVEITGFPVSGLPV